MSKMTILDSRSSLAANPAQGRCSLRLPSFAAMVLMDQRGKLAAADSVPQRACLK